MRTALSAALLAAVAALALGGCGSSKQAAAATTTTAAPPAQEPATTTTQPPTATQASVKASTSKDLTSKPRIPAQSGPAPKTLVVQDIVKGDGAVAEPGTQVSVQYVGVLYKNGRQFDASWDRGGQPFAFTLGAAQVIPGWDRGVAGMRVGGRRQLTIPSELAYGPNGTPDGSIPPDAPLIFVVDLRKVGG
jgi:peptidylprolyl isomerase